jgi:hypothetical protein
VKSERREQITRGACFFFIQAFLLYLPPCAGVWQEQRTHMKCVYGDDKDAVATCRFCGRAVCPDHIRTMNYIITVYIGSEKKIPKSLMVADAVWCGMCKPQPEPIEMPYLD